MALLDLGEQRCTVHARHPLVADDDVVRLLGEHGERLLAAAHERHLPFAPAGAQSVAEALEDLLLVVDEEDALHAATAGAPQGSSFSARTPIGSRTTPPTKAVGKGTGQGLALVRTVVCEHHNGAISVDRELGVGTIFEIRLPVAGVDAEGSDAE